MYIEILIIKKSRLSDKYQECQEKWVTPFILDLMLMIKIFILQRAKIVLKHFVLKSIEDLFVYQKVEFIKRWSLAFDPWIYRVLALPILMFILYFNLTCYPPSISYCPNTIADKISTKYNQKYVISVG
jgi:hypothetical protein